MIKISSIKNPFTRASMREMGDTVRNLTHSFANSSPSPDRTPEVARNLNRARNEAEETIVYMDKAKSAYTVTNDTDDEDHKNDEILAHTDPAYSIPDIKFRQRAGMRLAHAKPRGSRSQERLSESDPAPS